MKVNWYYISGSITGRVIVHLDDAFAVAGDFAVVERPHADHHLDGRHLRLLSGAALHSNLKKKKPTITFQTLKPRQP